MSGRSEPSDDMNTLICPTCQTTNRDIAQFCKECGRFLAGHCPNCGSSLPDAAKYCDICGSRLAPQIAQPLAQPAALIQTESPKPGPAPTRLARYIPQELLAKLEAAQASGTMTGERRVVTMLFCDVSGSTAAAEQLDPEEWASIINGVFEHMIAPVYHYEGTVARLMGDGLLAFFGAPISHEDDPQRAILASLDIVVAVSDYSRQIAQRFGFELSVRVGINTGRVVVGAVGSDLRLEYSALGDAINVAARMEQSAQPGTVQIAEDTYKLVAPLFEFEPLGGIAVKGKAEPVPAYRVLGRKAEPGSLRGLSGLASPLVGRGQELAKLQAGLADLAQGHGRILFLVGQAGLGKSRLIREAQAQPAPGESPSPFDLLVHRQATSYKASEAYSVSKGLVHLLFGLNGASLEETRALLHRQVAPLPDPEGAFLAFAGLLGLLAEEDGPALQGEAFKRHLFASTLQAVQTRAAARPLALVIDDLHWADPASVELIRHLFQLADASAILFLCAMRPDRETPGWDLSIEAAKEFPHRLAEIELQPLDQAQSNELLDSLLPGSTFPHQLRPLILDRADGNPFFIEEVIRTLIDQGILRVGATATGDPAWQVVGQVEAIHVPGSLEGLLAARLDRLDESCRRILQLAAVIGRSFDYRVLAHIAPAEADLDHYLSTLQRIDLIREVARQPERRYAFRNSLMQEIVYRSILRSQRRLYHRQTAEAILALYPGQEDEHLPMLASHFYQAADRRAVAYNARAGDAAYDLYANKEAAAFYAAALEILQPDFDIDSTTLTHLFSRRGRALELDSQFGPALDAYQEMERVARQCADQPLELAALLAQGTIYATPNEKFNAPVAESLAEKALALARALDAGPAEAKIYWNLLNLYRLSQGLDEALEAGEKALTLARELDLREQLAFIANDMAHVYYPLGKTDQGAQVVTEAIALWRELDNQPMLADSLATAALYHSLTGQFEQAIAFSDEAFQISQDIDNLWGQSYSRFAIGIVYWQLGQLGKALETMESCVRLGEQAGFMPAQLFTASYLALSNAHLGQFERALRLSRHAVALAEESMALYQPMALGYLSQILLLSGETEQPTRITDQLEGQELLSDPLLRLYVEDSRAAYALAIGDYQVALTVTADLLTILRQIGNRAMLPHALTLHGKALLGAGRLDDARQILLTARREADSLGARWYLWLILAALADVESASGDPAAARQLRHQAQAIVEELATQLPSQDYRDSFLATTAVKDLLLPHSGL